MIEMVLLLSLMKGVQMGKCPALAGCKKGTEITNFSVFMIYFMLIKNICVKNEMKWNI